MKEVSTLCCLLPCVPYVMKTSFFSLWPPLNEKPDKKDVATSIRRFALLLCVFAALRANAFAFDRGGLSRQTSSTAGGLSRCPHRRLTSKSAPVSIVDFRKFRLIFPHMPLAVLRLFRNKGGTVIQRR